MDRFSMFILAFIMLAVTPFVVSSDAHAQSSNSNGSPMTGVMPVGNPVEIVSGLNIPWSAVTVGQEILVSQRSTGEIVAFRPGGTLRSVGTVIADMPVVGRTVQASRREPYLAIAVELEISLSLGG